MDQVINNSKVLSEKHAHLEFIGREQRECRKKYELAKEQPIEYLSFSVNGADQTTFSLPSLVIATKEQQGHELRFHLLGSL